MKVALVHDDFTQLGGAEKLFEEIAKIYPDAPIYTSLVNYSKLPKSIDPKRIKTSFMQKIPFAQNFYKLLLPFYPISFESFDFSDYDLVISSTTRFAKSIVTKPKTIHICYINSVPRFLYMQNQKENYLPVYVQFILGQYFKWLKRWDKTSANRVDHFIANSQNVASKVKSIYNQKSDVVHPAMDTAFYKPNAQTKDKNHYLVVTRLVKWKKVEIAIATANELDVSLVVIGEGPDRSRLESLASNKVKFVGNLSREDLRNYYQNAKALIMTQEEDFGIASAEAQACGAPVIAYKSGGAEETIIDGKTGVFFTEQSAKSLKDAIVAHSKLKWDIEVLRANAATFSRGAFVKNLKQTIDNACKLYGS